MANKPETFMTVQDLAHESGISETTIRSAMARGRLEFVVKYGRKLIERDEWERYRKQVKIGRPLGAKNRSRPQPAAADSSAGEQEGGGA